MRVRNVDPNHGAGLHRRARTFHSTNGREGASRCGVPLFKVLAHGASLSIRSGMGSLFERLERIRGVMWRWNERAGELGYEPGSLDAGVIAQEVEAVFPDLVDVAPEGHKRVNYASLVGILLEALKELKLKHDALERRVVDLEQAHRVPAEHKPERGGREG